MSVQPLEDRIVIKPADAETRTESGIYLPKPKRSPCKARWFLWVQVDDWTTVSVKPAVKKGDIVVYGKYAGTEIEIKNTTHIIVRESELLGVIEG